MAGMAKKILKGAEKVFTSANTIADGGGLSSLLVTRKVNGLGMGLIVAGGTVFNTGKEGLKARNRSRMGQISYVDGPARMTKSYTTGAVPAMMNASGGNYAVFSDMAENVVKSNGNIVSSMLDDYGANPAMISALYGMGGR